MGASCNLARGFRFAHHASPGGTVRVAAARRSKILFSLYESADINNLCKLISVEQQLSTLNNNSRQPQKV
jgi:hypothetical protein